MIDVRLFPLLDPGKHFVKRSWLLPGVLTAVITVCLSTFNSPAIFFDVLALYICLVLYFFLYLFCHERKSFWTASVIAAFSFIVVASPLRPWLLFPFRPTAILNNASEGTGLAILLRFVSFFVSAGLAEEFIKAIPVLICLWIGARYHGKFGKAFGVRSPLEGILIGAASGIGFSLFETLQQYVPQVEHFVANTSKDFGLGIYVGLTLLIPRLLGDLFGHMAWAGYFGYFIGLAALRVLPTAKVLLVGWISAAALHGLWDTFSSSIVVSVIVACLSYCCLAAAILEGRRMHLETPNHRPAHPNSFSAAPVSAPTVPSPPTTAAPMRPRQS
jgi:RsiW-degrading membrane proteinase PrsW (M82 family)